MSTAIFKISGVQKYWKTYGEKQDNPSRRVVFPSPSACQPDKILLSSKQDHRKSISDFLADIALIFRNHFCNDDRHPLRFRSVGDVTGDFLCSKSP